MPLKESSLWQETATISTTDPARPLPERVDVAVVGGGYTGLSAARTLAQRGARVAVLEAQTFGWGASSRNGGMVLTGLKLPVGTLMARYGRETARRLFAASLASIDCVERIVHEEGIDCDFARCGHVELACKPAHFTAFARDAEVLAREFNHHVRVIPRSELGSEIGSPRYYGGLVDAVSAGLNPARYVAGLLRAAKKAGAEMFDHAPVEQFVRESGTFRVSTPRGLLRAHELFIATNGYTGTIAPALQKRVIPVGSYAIATEPLPEALTRELIPQNRMLFDSKNFLYYFRLTPDRRLLFGGRASFLPDSTRTVRASARILRRGMVEVYPQLRDAAVEHAWGGTLGFTFDMLPHAGRLHGVAFALGYGGHGVAMATYLGARVAAALAGEAVENPFAELPFPGAPFGLYHGTPWFLPLAGLWYRLLDWLT
ncbi:MAG: FAD-binding oxidoreductase [Ardenticatenaceae bacterium]|nr:FAD-binding oxidoreductase [Ardenticatenaceae bacterium]